jgi:hypothetical protein
LWLLYLILHQQIQLNIYFLPFASLIPHTKSTGLKCVDAFKKSNFVVCFLCQFELFQLFGEFCEPSFSKTKNGPPPVRLHF